MASHKNNPINDSVSKEDFSLDKVTATVCDYLDLFNDNKQERVEQIDELIHTLNFEKRLTLLTDEEANAMMDSDNSNHNDLLKLRLSNCSTDEQREEVIQDLARRTYFIKCAWSDYLNGVSDFKPLDSKREAQRTWHILSEPLDE